VGSRTMASYRSIVQSEPIDGALVIRAKASHVRWLARDVSDDEAAQRLRDFADELDATAAALDPSGE
jgi:hypothetical protein